MCARALRRALGHFPGPAPAGTVPLHEGRGGGSPGPRCWPLFRAPPPSQVPGGPGPLAHTHLLGRAHHFRGSAAAAAHYFRGRCRPRLRRVSPGRVCGRRPKLSPLRPLRGDGSTARGRGPGLAVQRRRRAGSRQLPSLEGPAARPARRPRSGLVSGPQLPAPTAQPSSPPRAPRGVRPLWAELPARGSGGAGRGQCAAAQRVVS